MMGRYKLLIASLLFGALLALALYLLREHQGSSTIPEEHRNFSIRDTGKIQRIRIADQDGNEALLERGVSHWTLNDSLRAQKHKIGMLLGTLHNMKGVKPVSDARMETVLRNMSTLSKKVEVYMKGDEEEPSRSYYLGTNTPKHDGTYMLLETPEHGRAERPFVVRIPWRRGFLNPRFFAEQKEWRYTGVFDYKIPNIRRIEMEHVRDPYRSFYLEKVDDGWGLFRMQPEQRVEFFDTVRVRDYLLNFKKAHVESYNHGLPQEKVDSILNSNPVYKLRVIDQAGDTNELTAYYKGPPKDPRVTDRPERDKSRMYALTDEGEFATIQRYVFSRFFQPISELRKDYSGKQRGYRRMGPEPPGGFSTESPMDRGGGSKPPPQAPR